MNQVTIPQTITKGEELVVISRREYEALQHKQKIRTRPIVVKRTMRVPKKHEKFYDEVDRRLTGALREYAKGKYHGPFETVEDGIQFLNRYKTERAKK